MATYEVYLKVLNPSKATEPQERFIVQGQNDQDAISQAVNLATKQNFAINSVELDSAIARRV